MRATRASVDVDFAFVEELPLPTVDLNGTALNSPYVVGGADGRLYFRLNDTIGQVRMTDWRPSEAPLMLIESTDRPVVTIDELTIYFGLGIKYARRSSPDEVPTVFSEDVSIDSENLRPSWISPDGCRLYFDQDGIKMAERQK